MMSVTTMLRGEMLRLADADGRVIRVQAGRLWITQEGEGTDHLGEAVSLPLQLAAA